MRLEILLLLFILKKVNCGLEKILLGGIFDDNTDHEKAFKFIVNLINNNDQQFSPIVQSDGGGPFKTLTTACSFLEEGVVAVFGPNQNDDINTVQSLCDHKEIPHIIFKPFHYPSIINFYPHAPLLIEAYFDVIKGRGWKSVTIFYENNESLLRIADLIVKTKKEIQVTVKQLAEGGDGIYRASFRAARMSGEKNFVIDCKIDNLEEILLQAQQVGLMTHQFNFFITNLDLQTVNLASIQFSEANITGLRIVNPDNELVALTTKALNVQDEEETAILRIETALLIDAVSMVAAALQQMPPLPDSAFDDISCNTTKSFIYGTTLINLIKGSEYTGLTGVAKFDNEGLRSSFELEVIALKETGVASIGTWSSKSRLNLSWPTEQQVDDDPESLRNKTFVVITCLTDPYGMLKETSQPLYGNERFEGFGIDLIHELSVMEGFNYTFIIRVDKKNGVKDPETGTWSGMIGDLMDHTADLAITDFTITSGREEVVDFTSPFMNLGISILAQKPGKAPPSFFSFADPFALNVWIMLALAYVVVSLSLYVIGRICAEEWTNPYPCIEEPEFLVNQFSLQNSAWFAIGSLMQQGTEIAPIAISTRMVAGMWWFFVLIIVSSYTANLAAFLATENPIHLFTDIHSLVENAGEKKIRFGAKAGGATAGFFKESDPFTNGGIYKKVAEHMDEHPEDMVKENKDGVALAENEIYAFFMESTSIEYEIQRHCNLQQYGDLLDDKGYGIAMRKNSTYRKRLSTAILKLQASGKLAQLKRKWWEERRGGGQCAGEDEATEATPLNLENVEGVFYVTIVGLVCSIFSVVIEMIIYTFRRSLKTKIPFKEALKHEIKAYLNFNSNVKPVHEGSQSKSKSTTKSKSKSESLKENSSGSDSVKHPEPYGFKVASLEERLTESS